MKVLQYSDASILIAASKPRRILPPRQREILRLVALGHTNREIAGSLGISVRTVEVHRFNLMHRLNVRNVAQLLRQALQKNLLPRNFSAK
ncbi:MAG: response regulator transcription factor [Nitrospira sp.]|nr:response regulator transcription factor [Nitrospira sp.]